MKRIVITRRERYYIDLYKIYKEQNLHMCKKVNPSMEGPVHPSLSLSITHIHQMVKASKAIDKGTEEWDLWDTLPCTWGNENFSNLAKILTILHALAHHTIMPSCMEGPPSHQNQFLLLSSLRKLVVAF